MKLLINSFKELFFFVLILIVSTINCSITYGQNPSCSFIVGKWYYPDSINNYFQYLPSGEVKMFIRNESYIDPDDGPVYYRLEQQNDTVKLTHRYRQRMTSKGNVPNYEERKAIRISGDYMEVLNYKGLKGIENHIDEYSLLVRETEGKKPFRFDCGLPLTKYILPVGFKGKIIIAYGQPNGTLPEFDSAGNRILRIPSNGLLETQIHEDAFGTAGRRYKFYVKDLVNGKLNEIPVVDKFDRNIKSFPAKTFGVVMQGFNQQAREDVNKAFHRIIKGNTMMIYVGYFEDAANFKIGIP